MASLNVACTTFEGIPVNVFMQSSDDLYSPVDINAMSEIPELIGRVSDIY